MAVPYKINKKCCLLRSCLVDARRMLLFIDEQVFLPMGELWLMLNADTQCTVGGGERRTKGREKFLSLNFSSLAVKYEFYLTV